MGCAIQPMNFLCLLGDTSMNSVGNQNRSATPSTSVLTAEASMNNVSQLLSSVEDSLHRPARVDQRAANLHENQLASARLGVAASLFLALKAKHAPTAAHSLRVAVLSSTWLETMQPTAEFRDELEIAALLHDIGKIGVPDQTLMKPGKLTTEELHFMRSARRHGVEILSACAPSLNVLEIVAHVGAWFNGQVENTGLQGEKIPLGARIISIIDAFDSMTTDSVYRPALSRERALAEMYGNAGTQFDPQLIEQFAHFLTFDHSRFEVSTARRWLDELQPEAGNKFWRGGIATVATTEHHPMANFHHHFLDGMLDAVFYIDSTQKILQWNKAAERMTGITAEAVLQNLWSPSLISLRNAQGKIIIDPECPLANAMCEQVPRTGRFELRHVNGLAIQVEAVFTPIISSTEGVVGATAQLHDASEQITLEERVHSLHERATRDTLTGVMNRSEFDRVFELFVQEHFASGRPCSLVICDLDFFKKVNDNYGHPAGDAALKAFAALLKTHCRAGDVVARFGGEEFLLLCADCNNATAAKRAEQIRQELSNTSQPMIGGNCLNASFGVTELQLGDDTHSMLARADRALLQAKDNGRNQVVQLGVGLMDKASAQPPGFLKSWVSWFMDDAPVYLIDRDVVTSVPLNITVEKLRGFVADHQAEIISIDAKQIVLQIDGEKVPLARRNSDRNIPYVIDIQFTEHIDTSDTRTKGKTTTFMHVTIRPKRGRDRRMNNVQERAKQIYSSLKSYLVAKEVAAAPNA